MIQRVDEMQEPGGDPWPQPQELDERVKLMGNQLQALMACVASLDEVPPTGRIPVPPNETALPVPGGHPQQCGPQSSTGPIGPQLFDVHTPMIQRVDEMQEPSGDPWPQRDRRPLFPAQAPR